MNDDYNKIKSNLQDEYDRNKEKIDNYTERLTIIKANKLEERVVMAISCILTLGIILFLFLIFGNNELTKKITSIGIVIAYIIVIILGIFISEYVFNKNIYKIDEQLKKISDAKTELELLEEELRHEIEIEYTKNLNIAIKNAIDNLEYDTHNLKIITNPNNRVELEIVVTNEVENKQNPIAEVIAEEKMTIESANNNDFSLNSRNEDKREKQILGEDEFENKSLEESSEELKKDLYTLSVEKVLNDRFFNEQNSKENKTRAYTSSLIAGCISLACILGPIARLNLPITPLVTSLSFAIPIVSSCSYFVNKKRKESKIIDRVNDELKDNSISKKNTYKENSDKINKRLSDKIKKMAIIKILLEKKKIFSLRRNKKKKNKKKNDINKEEDMLIEQLYNEYGMNLTSHEKIKVKRLLRTKENSK